MFDPARLASSSRARHFKASALFLSSLRDKRRQRASDSRRAAWDHTCDNGRRSGPCIRACMYVCTSVPFWGRAHALKLLRALASFCRAGDRLGFFSFDSRKSAGQKVWSKQQQQQQQRLPTWNQSDGRTGEEEGAAGAASRRERAERTLIQTQLKQLGSLSKQRVESFEKEEEDVRC